MGLGPGFVHTPEKPTVLDSYVELKDVSVN